MVNQSPPKLIDDKHRGRDARQGRAQTDGRSGSCKPMAVDITAVCKLSVENQSSQQLAIWLSLLFSIYTIVSIALSALAIYTTSQAGPLKRAMFGRGGVEDEIEPQNSSDL